MRIEWRRGEQARRATALLAGAVLVAAACSGGGRAGYRFGASGAGGWEVGSGAIDDLLALYPDYFAVILDPTQTRDPDLRPLRDDLERLPAGPRSYQALNALAVGYFELSRRASSHPPTYLADNFRAAKLVAVPWRAYSLIEEAALRSAILDFFEDAGSGAKPGTREIAPRLARIVASLEPKEADPARRARIHALAVSLETPPGLD